MKIKIILLICCLVSGFILYDEIPYTPKLFERLFTEKKQLNWDLEDFLRETNQLNYEGDSPRSQEEYSALIDRVRLRALLNLGVIAALALQILASLILLCFKLIGVLIKLNGIFLLAICAYYTRLYLEFFYECPKGETIIQVIFSICYVFFAVYLFFNSNTNKGDDKASIQATNPG